MLQDIRLYIDKKLVDFSNEISLPFTYQLEDLSNPAVIKNTFTKTITIQGTKNNNAIFGEIYNFDREQLYSDKYLTGVYFNPSQRTPFELYRNGEIIETGYMQLNDITIKKKEIQYNITLYGGLGDFFYSLAYNEENEPLQLKDLVYDEEISFNLDKNTIRKCWENLGKETGDISDIITFIPSYNGIYEDFDNDKVLINTLNSTFFSATTQTVDGKEYKTYNDYVLAELGKELTEWEIRSLMSYKQRPALRFRKFLNACCNPINNGGYEVELDNTFFNASNPYYNQSYIALPLLSEMEKSGEVVEDNITIDSTITVGQTQGGFNVISNSSPISVIGSAISFNDGIVNTNGFPNTTTVDVELDIQLYFQSKEQYINDLFFSMSQGLAKHYYSSLLMQIEAIDAETDTVIGRSNYYNFTNKLFDGYYSNPSVWGIWNNPLNTPMEMVFGHFVYSPNHKKHYFKSDSGKNTFKIKLEKCYKTENMKFNLVLRTVRSNYEHLGLYTTNVDWINIDEPRLVNGVWFAYADSSTSNLKLITEDRITSGAKINQNIMLKTEKTPLDYLISFCKLFNLYFFKKIGEKTIVITKKNNFFSGDIINIEDRIDWEKTVKISPIIYNKKFYKLSLEDNETFINKKYKNEYGVEYGQKRINTNYNFNNETQSMLDDNVYQNVVSMLDTSPYYHTFFNKDNQEIPPFTVENLTLKYYAEEDMETIDIEMYGSENVDLTKTKDWNKKSGYDLYDKICCYNKDDVKSLSDLESALVFYDGQQTLKDIEGNDIIFNVVDDIPEMYVLNNNNACHLYSESSFDRKGNWISYKLKSLPKFSRYIIKDNKITDSWDFGKPKELYIPNLQYDDKITLYNQYWNNIYSDKLNVNTKVFSCNVSLKGLTVNTNLLKNFYYFNGSYWLLNKIENYNINSNETVKCEFIKINEISNYLKDTGNVYDYFFVEDGYIKVPHYGATIKVNIYSTSEWVLDSYDTNNIKDIYPISGGVGTTQLTISYNANNNIYKENKFEVKLHTENNVVNDLIITIEQEPRLDKVVKLNGKVKNGNYHYKLFIKGVEDNIIYNSVECDYYSGDFSLFVPKNKEVWVEVHNEDEESIDYNRKFVFEDDYYLNIVL